VAWLDSSIPARDALECAYAHHMEYNGEDHPDIQGTAGCITDNGSAASIHQEWDIAVGCRNSRQMRSALQASAAQAFS